MSIVGNKFAEKHGMNGTKVHNAWCSMKKRCYGKYNISYKNYGAKGITVCEEWLNDFERFYLDMGEPPTKDHSLDRIDNNKGYYKENCRWATKSEQSFNRNPWKTVNKLGYKGVEKNFNRYSARIKHVHLGTFATVEEAAEAYNKEAEKHYGNNAVLNEIG